MSCKAVTAIYRVTGEIQIHSSLNLDAAELEVFVTNPDYLRIQAMQMPSAQVINIAALHVLFTQSLAGLV